MKRCKRKKAFIGGIIGAVGGIVGGLLSSSAAKNAADRQYALQKEQWETNQKLQNRKDTLSEAQNLSNRYSDQDYVDELKNKIVFKNGGNMKNKVEYNKLFACGGRSKKQCGGRNKKQCGGRSKEQCGGRKKAANGIDWNSVGASAANAIGTIGQAMINANTQNYITSKQRNWNVESSNNGDYSNSISKGKSYIKQPSYMDRIDYYKCGGKKRKK